MQGRCANGLYCNRGTEPCQRPIADGMPCTGNCRARLERLGYTARCAPGALDLLG